MHDSIFNHFKSRHRDGDDAFGDVSHRTVLSQIKIHYRGTGFVTIDYRLGEKEGFLAKIKKALVKRRRPLNAPN